MEAVGVVGWGVFALFILSMLALDMGAFHKDEKSDTLTYNLWLSLLWISFALIFNAGVWYFLGFEPAKTFLAGYLLEKTLGVDNLFVFVLIFKHFNIQKRWQHRILQWGILSALVMRAIFIGAGIAIVTKFHFVLYFFGAFLIFAAIKMLRSHNQEDKEPSDRWVHLIGRVVPLTKKSNNGDFFLKENGKWFATPAFQALVAVEISDLIFALDSVPAILAISTDTFIVYTSNIFAILGLRSLYFTLAGLVDIIRYLHYGLAIAIGFIGVKILIADFYHIPVEISLLCIAICLGGSVFASWLAHRRHST